MRIILDFMICIAVAPGLYSFQNPVAAALGGAIRGHVLQSKSGEPVKKAVVIVRRGKEPGTGTVTDASGAFQFDNIEAGAYTLSTEHTGFILDPESERTVVDVKDGPDNSEVTLRLIPTGAISGRVLDSDGEPVTGAVVQIVPLNQKKGAGPSPSAVTNDRGEYRSFNISPGKYRIAVSYEPRFQQMQIKMQRPPTRSRDAPDQTYALTYYPSVLDSKQADTVDVGAGADLQGFDVRILRAPGVDVRGTVSVAGGAPVGAIVLVTLAPIRQTIGFRARDNMIQDSSGAFELTEVLPGTYLLGAMAPLNDKKLSASRIIEVGSANVDAVQLMLAPPQTINGAVIVPEGRKMPIGLIAVLMSRESRDNRSGGMSQPGSDGVFQMRDVPPGDYDVVLGTTTTGNDLYVSAVQMGDDDALADGIHIGGPAVGPLKIILKGGGGTLQASVKDSHGKPLPDSYVKLVPDPPRRAQMALYADCKTDASGMCELPGVAPGNYHAFAFVEERQIDFRDPAAAADIEDSGKPVAIMESARQGIELNPVPDDK